jgi:hypothetical protein
MIYIRRRGWTPQWEERLLRLTERARRQEPLFGPGLPDVPPRRTRPELSPEERLARLRRPVWPPWDLLDEGDWRD